MRRIEKTILDGGFLTESLYVPKYVWYQKEAKIPEIDKKVHYFDELKKEFQKVSILYSKNCLSKDKNVGVAFSQTIGSGQADDLRFVSARHFVLRVQ